MVNILLSSYNLLQFELSEQSEAFYPLIISSSIDNPDVSLPPRSKAVYSIISSLPEDTQYFSYLSDHPNPQSNQYGNKPILLMDLQVEFGYYEVFNIPYNVTINGEKTNILFDDIVAMWYDNYLVIVNENKEIIDILYERIAIDLTDVNAVDNTIVSKGIYWNAPKPRQITGYQTIESFSVYHAEMMGYNDRNGSASYVLTYPWFMDFSHESMEFTYKPIYREIQPSFNVIWKNVKLYVSQLLLSSILLFVLIVYREIKIRNHR